jgi:putative transposase
MPWVVMFITCSIAPSDGATLFAKATDYEAFVRVLSEALDWVDIRLLAYCAMPNHWHLVVWPQRDGDLSEFMCWLTLTHAQRWHAKHDTQGTGPLYQGRFTAFPVDEHCLCVLRYVKRNPLRAGLARSARRWRWGSLGRAATLALPGPPLETGPVAKPERWQEWVDRPESEAELTALRRSVVRGVPFGAESWQRQTAKSCVRRGNSYVRRMGGRVSSFQPRNRPMSRPGIRPGAGLFASYQRIVCKLVYQTRPCQEITGRTLVPKWKRHRQQGRAVPRVLAIAPPEQPGDMCGKPQWGATGRRALKTSEPGETKIAKVKGKP